MIYYQFYTCFFQKKPENDPATNCPFGPEEQKCMCSMYLSHSRQLVKPTRAPITTIPPVPLSPTDTAACVSLNSIINFKLILLHKT